MEPTCPVCGKLLTKTDINNIYYCPRRQATPEEAVPHAVIDATIKFDEDGKELIKIIEIPPYVFTITNGQRTKVKKFAYPTFKILEPEYINVLDIGAAMNLPWHDREEVLRRLRIYVLFS